MGFGVANSVNDRSVDPEPYAAPIDDSKMIGQVLGGRYRLDSQVEGDVLGAVYRAADLAANESPFAVCMLRSEFGRFSEAMALLRAEIRVTRMLRHPHIARVYSLNSDRQGVYLVTEYLEGRTLEAVLRENGTGLPLIEARRMVADMGAALAYAHDLDVVHGDLQPANVFVMLGRAKLLHFGLTRAAATRNGRFDPRRCRSQTIAYAAFEMLQGGAPDPRDDVYSFACIIYTMLSGAHPFGSRSAVEARDLEFAMTPLQILSKDQNAALAQALSFEHAQRTPSVTALLAGLGWTADPPAAAAPAPASAAIPASAAATAESTPPAAAASEQPTPPRSARRGPGLLPIPSISAFPQDLPKPPKRPSRPKRPAAPAPRESRGLLMPALIVLSLSLLVVGIGFYVHRRMPRLWRSRTPRSTPRQPHRPRLLRLPLRSPLSRRRRRLSLARPPVQRQPTRRPPSAQKPFPWRLSRFCGPCPRRQRRWRTATIALIRRKPWLRVSPARFS